MKKSLKIIIILLIIIAIIVSVFFFLTRFSKQKISENNIGIENVHISEGNVENEFVTILEDGTRLNTSNKLKEAKKFEGFEISDLQLTEKDNITLLLGTITNVSQTKQGGYSINVTFIDKSGNELTTIAAIIGELEPGESDQFSTNVMFDYSNSYDFIISKR